MIRFLKFIVLSWLPDDYWPEDPILDREAKVGGSICGALIAGVLIALLIWVLSVVTS